MVFAAKPRQNRADVGPEKLVGVQTPAKDAYRDFTPVPKPTRNK
jgi:hypothetical protein